MASPPQEDPSEPGPSGETRRALAQAGASGAAPLRVGFRRILLKLSGEALLGEQSYGIEPASIDRLAHELHHFHRKGIEVGLVIGGGNIFRGVAGAARGLSRVSADYMGMLATIINALAFQDVLIRSGIPAQIFTPFEMAAFASRFNAAHVKSTLKKGIVTIFAGGTGNPYFSTDSAAALRAAEIDADILLKATKVDGVFDKDPMQHEDAVRYERLTYQEFLQHDLKVMDATAVALCRDVKMPIMVFNLWREGSLERVAAGDISSGTLVH